MAFKLLFDLNLVSLLLLIKKIIEKWDRNSNPDPGYNEQILPVPRCLL